MLNEVILHFQLVVIAAIIAVSQAVVLPGGGVVSPYGVPGVVSPYGVPAVARLGVPVAKIAAPVEDYDPNPQYSYSYDIHVR